MEHRYFISEEDWRELEEKFVSSYTPVLQFVTENKGSFSEARETYLEGFHYFIQSVELRGRDYLEKCESLTYSFCRILWLKKLAKRNVNLDMVKHRREFFDLDEVFHELEIQSERGAKLASELGEVGEPCRTLMLEIIGRQKPFDQVGARLGFSDEERAMRRIAVCSRKLIQKIDGKEFSQSEDKFYSSLLYILYPDREAKPAGDDMEVCLAMMSRVIAAVRSHATAKERNLILRDFRDRLLPDGGEVLQKIDSEPKSEKMKSSYIVLAVIAIAVAVSAITSYTISSDIFMEEEITELPPDTAVVDTIQIETIEWRERTAILISEKGYALTSASDLKMGAEIEVRDNQNNLGRAKVSAVDTAIGLALLKVDSVFATAVPFRLKVSESKVGQELVTLGYKDGKLLFAKANTQLIETDSEWITGNGLYPGAPLFTDHGELSGILTNVDESGKSVNAERIQNFLNQVSNEKINLPSRNRLYYSNTAQRVQKLEPCIFQIKFKA